MKCFEILVEDPVESLIDVPCEPNEEEDDIDLYLWRYCHDHNRLVLVRVGSETLKVALDPDFRIILFGMPREVRGIEAGGKGSLGFSESGSDVYFVPERNTILCTAHRWGAKTAEPTIACERSQVIEELWRFLHWIAEEAVAGGYLKPEQAVTFLGEH